MVDLSSKVQSHYTRGTLHERVFGWLAENDVDPANVTREQL